MMAYSTLGLDVLEDISKLKFTKKGYLTVESEGTTFVKATTPNFLNVVGLLRSEDRPYRWRIVGALVDGEDVGLPATESLPDAYSSIKLKGKKLTLLQELVLRTNHDNQTLELRVRKDEPARND